MGEVSLTVFGKMTRREAGWMVVRAAAVAGGQEFFASWLASAPLDAHTSHGHQENAFAPPEPDRWSEYQPKFFSAEEFQILDHFTAILVPSDETPGAREAYVAPFIDFVINAAAEYAPEMQQHWHAAVEWLHRNNFAQLSAPQQLSLIEEMSGPERDSAKTHNGFFAYQLIKEMTLHAFYTSRVGLVDELEYKGNAYLVAFPGCTHPEHHRVD